MKLQVEIRPEEFNATLNPTARGLRSGSTYNRNPVHSEYWLGSISERKHPDQAFTALPVFNQIQFFDKEDASQEPIIVANLSKPIQKIKDTTFVIEVQIDF